MDIAKLCLDLRVGRYIGSRTAISSLKATGDRQNEVTSVGSFHDTVYNSKTYNLIFPIFLYFQKKKVLGNF